MLGIHPDSLDIQFRDRVRCAISFVRMGHTRHGFVSCMRAAESLWPALCFALRSEPGTPPELLAKTWEALSRLRADGYRLVKDFPLGVAATGAKQLAPRQRMKAGHGVVGEPAARSLPKLPEPLEASIRTVEDFMFRLNHLRQKLAYEMIQDSRTPTSPKRRRESLVADWTDEQLRSELSVLQKNNPDITLSAAAKEVGCAKSTLTRRYKTDRTFREWWDRSVVARPVERANHKRSSRTEAQRIKQETGE